MVYIHVHTQTDSTEHITLLHIYTQDNNNSLPAIDPFTGQLVRLYCRYLKLSNPVTPTH